MLLLFAPRAQAEAGDSVTFRQAIAAGAKQGPLVREAERVRIATDAFASHPGGSLPSVPQVTLLAGARAPTGLPVGPEVVVTATQEISLRGLGSARSRVASWAARAGTSDTERSALEGAALAALAWIHLLEAQRLMQIRSTAAEAADRISNLATLRAANGVATAVERSLAHAELGSARLDVLDAEGHATEARLDLAYSMGASMSRSYVAEGSADVAAIDANEQTLARLDLHPSVLSARARAEQSRAEALVLHATNGPTFSVGASVWREGSGDKAIAGVFVFPLPFFDPAQYDTARQETLAAAADGHALRLRAELERELRLAIHERLHTREVYMHLQDDVVTPLRSSVTTSMTSYAAGTATLETVLLARRAALAAEERLVRAEADVNRADVRVAALSGTLLRTVQR